MTLEHRGSTQQHCGGCREQNPQTHSHELLHNPVQFCLLPTRFPWVPHSQTFSLVPAPGSSNPFAPTSAAGALWSSLSPKGVELARGGPSGPGRRWHVMRWLLSSRMRVVMPLTCSRSSKQVKPFSS